MSNTRKTETVREPLFHLSKRESISPAKAWAIRIMPTLPWKRPNEDFSQFWQEEILQELPEL